MKERLNDYPIDIFGVKNIGVDRWLSECNYSPVHGRIYSEIYKTIASYYIKLFCHQGTDEIVYRLAVSNNYVNLIATSTIFNQMRLVELEKANYQYIYSKTKQSINEYNWLSYPTELSNIYSYQKSYLSRRSKQTIKSLYFFIKNSGANPISVASLKPCFFQGHISDLASAYCQQYSYIPVFITPSLKKQQIHEKQFQDSKIPQLIHQFIHQVIKEYPCLSNSWQNFLRESIELTFKDSYVFFMSNLQKLKSQGTKLLSTGLGNPINRTFISAWRYSGGETIGFTHGNSFATSFNSAYIDFDGLSILNRQYAASQGEAALLKSLAARHSKNLNMAEITCLEKSVYQPIFEKMQRDAPVKKIKVVMLIGFPMTQFYYPYLSSHHALSMLRLEIELLKLLNKEGYKTIYKAHPDRLKEVSGIFDNYADLVINTKFEDVYHLADCIVFTQPHTSTFGYAMLTNRPIVLLNHKELMWDEDALASVSKRCRVVPSYSSANDGIIVDENRFLDAVSDSRESIDYQVIYKYAL